MTLIIISGICILFTLLFLVLWLRERRHAREAEIVAYGLRAQDDSNENTKTNITMIQSEHDAAIQKLVDLGEIKQDDWGRWVWTRTGEPMGE